MIRKLNNIYEFFKSTLLINLSVCLLTFFMGSGSFYLDFLTFGFLVSIGFKELYRKNDYLFYANNGVSKGQLLVGSYLFAFVVTVCTGLIVFLIKALF